MESYDNKEWDRLKAILAPSIRVDYSAVGGECKENVTPDDFTGVVAGFIADKRVKSQHFLGAQKWEAQDDGAVHISSQIRAAHQRYADESLAAVISHGHGHGVTQIWCRKYDGVWKLEGMKVAVNWIEYDLAGTLAPPKQDTKT